MISKATNGKSQDPIHNADACFQAMERHHDRTRRLLTNGTPSPAMPVGEAGAAQPPDVPDAPSGTDHEVAGDIVYGARAIAKFIFGDASDTARRRVFGLWAFYKLRKERAGFFKMKGGLCLSKSLWRQFHGLG